MQSTEEDQKTVRDLVHLARLALAGRPQDIQLFIRRISKRYRDSQPALADELAALARESPTRESPLRRDVAATVPVDLDSRLHLIRLEHVSALDIEPIWAESVRASLEQLVKERLREEELARAKLSPTRTVIFTGPPGVGKSLAARWLAHKLGRPLVALDLSAVMSSFLGRTGTNLRHVLDYAKGVDCVLLLDELDAIAKRRDDAHEVGELKRLVTVLLQEIDDWPPSGLLVAATNHPDLLDPAVWRRFDIKVDFPLPDASATRQAVQTFLGTAGALPPKMHDVVVHLLSGLSFSDIERELTSARRNAVVHDRPLEAALHDVIRRRFDALPRSGRGDVAASLATLDLSQRQIHDLTGVSRDTIRKATKRATSVQ